MTVSANRAASRRQDANWTSTDTNALVLRTVLEWASKGMLAQTLGRWTLLGSPFNAHSRRGFHGANTLALWAAQDRRNFTTGAWVTHHQAERLERRILNGERRHATPVVYVASQPPAEGQERTKICRWYKVWNLDQVEQAEALRLRLLNERAGSFSGEPIDDSRTILAGLGVTVEASAGNADTARYDEENDVILTPPKRWMRSERSYYARVLREAVTATGAEGRLNRWSILLERHSAYEALVTMLGTSFLAARLGFPLVYDVFDTPSYRQQWYAELVAKGTPAGADYLARACADAAKAMRYLAGDDPEGRIVPRGPRHHPPPITNPITGTADDSE